MLIKRRGIYHFSAISVTIDPLVIARINLLHVAVSNELYERIWKRNHLDRRNTRVENDKRLKR